MRLQRNRRVGLVFGLLLVWPAAAHAWNGAGHRAIAEIAYDQLDTATRTRVAELLKKHPAAEKLWADRPTNGPNEELNLFGNASIFPDEARRPPWDQYNRPTEHYVNFRIFAEEGNRVAPPIAAVSVLSSYPDHVRRGADAKTPVEERALDLSWIFHQAGDIHQPLHAVARFSRALPEGDRGGNDVTVPNPNPIRNPIAEPSKKGRPARPYNLHAYWDDLLGRDDSPDGVKSLADSLMKEYPRASFTQELQKMEIRDWAEESVAVSLKTVYRDLDANVTRFDEMPIAYRADAQRAARRRAALAGYRLAAELDRMFHSK
jgi:hypothetical protein